MNSNNVKHIFLKQSSPRLWLGALRDMMTRTQSYYALINMSMLLITTYSIREAAIKNYIPGFNFWWLIGVLGTMIITVALLDYKFVYPSQIAFHQHEAWKHRSLVRQTMEQEREEATERAKRMENRLERLEEMLSKLLEGKGYHG